MTVSVRKGQLDYFRRRCRATSNEVFSVLVGRYNAADDNAEIVRIEHPELAVSTPCRAEIDGEIWCAIVQAAVSDGLVVLGTIHSHPDWMPVVSPTDYDLFNGCKLVGIVEVQKSKRTRVAFWIKTSSLPCPVIYQ